MENKLEYYSYLLTLSYDEAVIFLLDKYGISKDDYFREKSYEKFLKKQIKSITSGKYKRTSEGLYCHHISENKYLNLSNKDYILNKKYPFKLHKKEQLVYCDLFEHLILHALIAKETDGEFGIPGYDTYLYPMILEGYIGGVKPQKREWLKKCYERAFLDPNETKILLLKINSFLPEKLQNSGEVVYISPEERQKQYLENKLKREKQYEKEAIEWRKRQVLRAIEEKEQRNKEFYRIYPNFKKMDIDFDVPRSKVISMLYDSKYRDSYKSKKELDLAMKPFIKDKLLDELYLFSFPK
ncbi:hypothetical protein [Marinilactibacillus psychrotolerans]|uniref:hypothetical protein n=1 Tax=Marinilactibacillus psychrotolerans TaxID=191770 RepID=UPI001D014D90|nr:hypothetical protein [Marinilactibacillus psychrotolerans]